MAETRDLLRAAPFWEPALKGARLGAEPWPGALPSERPQRVADLSFPGLRLSGVVLLPTDARPGAVGCYQSGVPVWDSGTLRTALADEDVTSVFVFQDVLLSILDFNFARTVNLSGPGRSVNLYGCPGTAINVQYNWTRAGITVGWGASLSISGLTFTNTYLMNQPLWPRYFAPLLSLVDVVPYGTCRLSSVSLVTPDKSDLALYMADYANSTSLSGDALPVYTAAPNGTAVSIARWALSGASFWPASPGISESAANASVWDLTDVNVSTQPLTQCLSSTGVPGVVARSGAVLRQLLSDTFVTAIQVVNDITFVASEWPPEASSPDQGQVFVNGTKEVYACHPNPTGRYTIDFGNLGQVVFVFGTLRWRGSLHMSNTRASPRRSWLYLLIGALSVETDGVIDFEGVEIASTVPSPFTNADDPFWTVQCGSLCPSFIPNKSRYRNVSYYDAFIYDYRFYKTDWVAVSQGRNITGTGFWGTTPTLPSALTGATRGSAQSEQGGQAQAEAPVTPPPEAPAQAPAQLKGGGLAASAVQGAGRVVRHPASGDVIIRPKEHQLHTGQTTISGIPHNDSVHNLLEGEGATVYGNSAATSKLNIYASWDTAKEVVDLAED
ncbi:hypothetical protein HYH03_017459 [Edaphochlamys debaryana]|uniref:Uncharacterized protein n=1 Tax=Edaphochlamys debaryana TaxID=47281 RepID=A0A836BNV1_9CHLO|nr:hypothetical protein HYH03_017459 [Edaphochlamys debaryana]|eukprot:KAG2483656.1 hypothetical protein HYH03_017459 [Edaphochlamys debaryana]